jgi:hypothetical protein
MKENGISSRRRNGRSWSSSGASPSTGREITERMDKETGWSRSTTLTLLRRLEAKGAVVADSGDGVKRFSPALRGGTPPSGRRRAFSAASTKAASACWSAP